MLPLVIGVGAGYALTGALSAFGLVSVINTMQTQPDWFTPEKQQKMLDKYREDLGIGKDFKYSAGSFKEYVETRDQNVDELNLFKDKSIQAAIKKSDDLANLLKNTLNHNHDSEGKDILAQAEAEYEESADVFGELIKSIPPYKVEQVIQAMKELADEGTKGIKEQHAYEKAHLSDTLDKPETIKALKDAGIKDINAAKKSMLEDLETTQEAQLKAFTDSTAASRNKLHLAARTEMDRIIFIATLRDMNEKNREAIRLAAAEAAAEKENKDPKNKIPPVLVGGFGTDPKDPNVGVVQISDLKTIYTNTGKTITQDNSGTFTLEMGRSLFNPSYYFLGDKPESDMTLMARAVKAKGHSAIEMDVEFNNKDMARDRAKQAYRACIEAGFPPEKIKIKINGNAMKLEDIFDKQSQEPARLTQRSNEIKGADPLTIKEEGHDTKAIKAKIQELRKAAKQDKPDAAAESLPSIVPQT